MKESPAELPVVAVEGNWIVVKHIRLPETANPGLHGLSKRIAVRINYGRNGSAGICTIQTDLFELGHELPKGWEWVEGEGVTHDFINPKVISEGW